MQNKQCTSYQGFGRFVYVLNTPIQQSRRSLMKPFFFAAQIKFFVNNFK
jgi:hypothetical protein